MSDQHAVEIERLLRQPYHRVISGNPEDGYLGEVPELPGCYTTGDTPVEALANLEEAMAAWLESCLISGDPIPGPARSLSPVA
ncbi:MAG TPA: type II toxin-antitoxin system HicB family antitoxin [Tepidiformaceae bacterium]|nr:type II toxin-antitoxin system HicB family antitoxin [Tepidiformaceae bacterium]